MVRRECGLFYTHCLGICLPVPSIILRLTYIIYNNFQMCIVPSYSTVFISLLLSSASYRFRTLGFVDIYLHTRVLTILL